MGTDKLKEINKENICDVLQTLKRYWPSSIQIYYFIWIQMKWLDVNSNMKSIKVYQYGKPAEELFVASVHYLFKDTMINRVAVHSQIKDDEKVKQLLLEADGIDWSLCPTFCAVIEKDVPIIQELCKIKNKRCFSDGLFNQMWLPLEKQQALSIIVSPDIYIGDLTEEHIPRVNDTWRYKSPQSEQLVRDAVVYNKGMGLFRKTDNKLVAWTVMAYYGALGMLYTEDDERGKGYGKLISLALSKYLIGKEIDPYVNIRVDNTPSFSLFKKMGFEIIDKVAWISTSK